MTPLMAALNKLTAAADGLIASRLTQSQRKALDDFARHTGAIRKQRKGNGTLYRISKPAVIQQKQQILSPLQVPDAELPQRAANIGQSRTSKGAQHQHSCCYVLLKAKGNVSWQNNGHKLNLTERTRHEGAACLQIGNTDSDDWTSQQPLWLIENQALFDRTDWLTAPNATLIWYRGQLQDQLIDWLAAKHRSPQLIHFPDYDGVGLNNYTRLKAQLGEKVDFWFMPHWQRKLARYGSNSLYKKTANYLDNAYRQLTPHFASDQSLQLLFRQLQQQGLALEQEAVWLPA